MKKIAIPTRNNMVDDHFGHCDHYTIFTVDDNDNIISTEQLESPQGCGCKSDIATKLHDMNIRTMLAGNMGNGAFNKLTEQNIEVVRGCSGNINTVLSNYLAGKITDSAEACDHHDCNNYTNNNAINTTKLKLNL